MGPIPAVACQERASSGPARPRLGGAGSARAASPVGRSRRRRCSTRGAVDAAAERREGARGRTGACGALPRWVANPALLFDAGPHKLLVSINENTSAGALPTVRLRAGRHWIYWRKRRLHEGCTAARSRNNKPEQARPTSNRCRSLLIHRFRHHPRAETVRSGGSRSARHGQRPLGRPPSPLTESGGRP